MSLVNENISYKIIGVCMKVHHFLGYGFLEIVYKDAMQTGLANKDISHVREKEFDINYKGIILPHKFYADFVAQALNYLKVSGCELGLVINFGKSSLEYKGLVL